MKNKKVISMVVIAISIAGLTCLIVITEHYNNRWVIEEELQLADTVSVNENPVLPDYKDDSVLRDHKKKFNDLRDLHYTYSIGSEEYKEYTLMMFYLAKTFQDYRFVNFISPYGSTIKNITLKKMIELAESLDEWISIYKKSPYGSDIKKLVSEKILNLVKTFEDCVQVSEVFKEGSEEEGLLIIKIIEIGGAQEQWKMLYLSSEEGSKIQILASEKMNE